MRQEQFLTVASLEEARARWQDSLPPFALRSEQVPLADALGRVLACPVRAPGDVPAFDRSNVDGFAVRAADTFGASEANPIALRLLEGAADAGVVSGADVAATTTLAIATGGVLPRGADAVVMVENVQIEDGESERGGTHTTIHILHAVVPGERVSQAGSDVARDETILQRGTRLTARETGILAACGIAEVEVVRRPRVGILSTGDEIVAPGTPLAPGQVHDANATMLAHAVTELGAEATSLGIAPDDAKTLRRVFAEAAPHLDMLLLSGGTSKGRGDLTYRVLEELGSIVVHGVALKPGKPLCLAVLHDKPVAVLPGFPTSAIFTFHAAVAHVLRAMVGVGALAPRTLPARLLRHQRSERGRTEFCLVSLVPGEDIPLAVPLGKGSGSVTTFARADGFFAIGTEQEFVEADTVVHVTPLAEGVSTPDLVIVGSHCVGLDALVGAATRSVPRIQVVMDGSQGGLRALAAGACDIAPVHLLDPETATWNAPFAPEDATVVPGYQRTQGLAFRAETAEAIVGSLGGGSAEGDDALHGSEALRDAVEARLRELVNAPGHVMANRSPGSGTRVLIDTLVAADGARPEGWSTSYRSHTAVAASVAQGRADFGVCLQAAAEGAGLRWLPWRDEHYDFVVRTSRRETPGVRAFLSALADPAVRTALRDIGFVLS